MVGPPRNRLTNWKWQTAGVCISNVFISVSSHFSFSRIESAAEKWTTYEVLGLPTGGAPELHSNGEREVSAGLQANVSGCGNPSVSGADNYPSSLGASQAGEGEVQAVRQGDYTQWMSCYI